MTYVFHVMEKGDRIRRYWHLQHPTGTSLLSLNF